MSSITHSWKNPYLLFLISFTSICFLCLEIYPIRICSTVWGEFGWLATTQIVLLAFFPLALIKKSTVLDLGGDVDDSCLVPLVLSKYCASKLSAAVFLSAIGSLSKQTARSTTRLIFPLQTSSQTLRSSYSSLDKVFHSLPTRPSWFLGAQFVVLMQTFFKAWQMPKICKAWNLLSMNHSNIVLAPTPKIPGGMYVTRSSRAISSCHSNTQTSCCKL